MTCQKFFFNDTCYFARIKVLVERENGVIYLSIPVAWTPYGKQALEKPALVDLNDMKALVA